MPHPPQPPSYKVFAPTSGVTKRVYGRQFLKKALEESKRTFFDVKVSEWLSDTRWQSSMSYLTAHPAFTEIKNMGDLAIKFILLRMKSGDIQLHWFPVLHDLAHTDPVPASKRGFVPDMTDAWLQWGRETGRI